MPPAGADFIDLCSSSDDESPNVLAIIDLTGTDDEPSPKRPRLAAAAGASHLAAAALVPPRPRRAKLAGCFLELVTGPLLFSGAAPGGFAAVKSTFADTAAYVDAFSDLLLEETREGLRAAWQESARSETGLPARVSQLATCGSGWYSCRLLATELEEAPFAKRCQEGSVLVLSSVKPGKAARSAAPTHVSRLHLAAVVENRGEKDVAVLLRLFLGKAVEDGEPPAEPLLQALKEAERVWYVHCCGRLASSIAEYSALHEAGYLSSDVARALYNPTGFPAYAELPPPPFQKELAGLEQHMRKTFNDRQTRAICWAAAAFDASASTARRCPFTMVQGPPGTGKTHTLWGMLNVFHAMALRREEGSLIAALRHKEECSSDDEEDPLLSFATPSLSLGALTACKPHILVCAPSNAAVDVLVQRILALGFFDANGSPYIPRIARLASQDAATAVSVASVDVGRAVDMLAGLKKADADRQVAQAEIEVERARGKLSAFCAENVAQPGSCSAALFVAAAVEYRRKHRELGRLQLQLHLPNRRSSREKAEASLLVDSDIVFCTLGTAGRSILGRLSRPFDIVLIDEAAQATEMSTLVALHRASTVVLVGDQRQLPATVLSTQVRQALYQRSLFERFTDCGVSPLLLEVQFRMHPDIMAFPSSHFYGGRLMAAPSVLSRPPQPFYAELPPFALFNVDGTEGRPVRSSSSLNSAEAAAAAALLAQLMATLGLKDLTSLVPRIGLLTPYRGQCDELRRVITTRFGAAVVAELDAAKSINTVDGFQGAERDIVIFSCVRTGRSLGFTDDVQRINVGLTRARHSLWVLGNVAALARSAHWGKLVRHAQATGRLLEFREISSVYTKRE